jgi:hypothetical protein
MGYVACRDATRTLAYVGSVRLWYTPAMDGSNVCLLCIAYYHKYSLFLSSWCGHLVKLEHRLTVWVWVVTQDLRVLRVTGRQADNRHQKCCHIKLNYTLLCWTETRNWLLLLDTRVDFLTHRMWSCGRMTPSRHSVVGTGQVTILKALVQHWLWWGRSQNGRYRDGDDDDDGRFRPKHAACCTVRYSRVLWRSYWTVSYL